MIEPALETGIRPAGADQPPAASLTSIEIRRDGAAPGRRHDGDANAAPTAAPPAPTAVPVAAPAVASPSAPPSATPANADLHGYWMSLKDDVALPAWSALDQERVLERWPNSIILLFPDGADRPRPDLESRFAHALRDAKASHADRHPTEMSHSPQMTEWMLSLGQEAARRVRPVRDSEVQPSLTGRVRFCAVALPFGGEGGRVERVLCHIWRERPK